MTTTPIATATQSSTRADPSPKDQDSDSLATAAFGKAVCRSRLDTTPFADCAKSGLDCANAGRLDSAPLPISAGPSDSARLEPMVQAMIDRKVDVIVAVLTPAIDAARARTSTIPIVFFAGLALIPIGIALAKRKVVDNLNEFEQRQEAWRRVGIFFAVMTVANVVIASQLSYRAVEHMDTVQFCGQTCHVMKPEFTAHAALAPHHFDGKFAGKMMR